MSISYCSRCGRAPAGDTACRMRSTAAIVLPLRVLRRKLRSDRDGDVQRLRGRIKTLEIAAERIVQHRLARLAGTPAGDTAPAARVAAAEANLALVLGPKMAGAAEATRIREALKAFLRG
jgi:hypothetical protein